jgi:hypothetical protein
MTITFQYFVLLVNGNDTVFFVFHNNPIFYLRERLQNIIICLQNYLILQMCVVVFENVETYFVFYVLAPLVHSFHFNVAFFPAILTFRLLS